MRPCSGANRLSITSVKLCTEYFFESIIAMPVFPWKKRPKLVLLTLFGVLLILVLFGGDYNFASIWDLYQKKKALSEQVEQLRIQNQILSDQIKLLKEDPEAIEKVAREKLGMAGKGENIYRILPEGPDSASDSLKTGK